MRVLFFGQLKDVTGRGEDSLVLPDGACVADVLAECERRYPKLADFLSACAIAVNQEFASSVTRLKENDEIALLPPVSGGAPESGQAGPLVRIVRQKIEPQAIVSGRARPEDGAIVVFDGVVRDHSRGHKTLYLDYQAYEAMVLKQMQALAEEALRRFAVRDVALIHRLGRLEIGESSVFIAVFSAHRAAAFDACRWLIDTLKKTVPIWKKEYFADGAVWADGEPFPAEMAVGTKAAR